MNSYIDLYSTRINFEEDSKPVQTSEVMNAVDVFDPRNAYCDNRKSYVANAEIYSSAPYFDVDGWFAACGV